MAATAPSPALGSAAEIELENKPYISSSKVGAAGIIFLPIFSDIASLDDDARALNC